MSGKRAMCANPIDLSNQPCRDFAAHLSHGRVEPPHPYSQAGYGGFHLSPGLERCGPGRSARPQSLNIRSPACHRKPLRTNRPQLAPFTRVKKFGIVGSGIHSLRSRLRSCRAGGRSGRFSLREILGEERLDCGVQRDFVIELVEPVALTALDLLLVRHAEFLKLLQEVF